MSNPAKRLPFMPPRSQLKTNFPQYYPPPQELQQAPGPRAVSGEPKKVSYFNKADDTLLRKVEQRAKSPNPQSSFQYQPTRTIYAPTSVMQSVFQQFNDTTVKNQQQLQKNSYIANGNPYLKQSKSILLPSSSVPLAAAPVAQPPNPKVSHESMNLDKSIGPGNALNQKFRELPGGVPHGFYSPERNKSYDDEQPTFKFNQSLVPYFKNISGTSIIGRRPQNEDRELFVRFDHFQVFAVFDGHGGYETAQFCKDNIVRVFQQEVSRNASLDCQKQLFNTFVQLDKEWAKRNNVFEGCTATLIMVDLSRNRIYSSNVGDSISIIGLRNRFVATLQHKPSEKLEIERLRKFYPQTQIVNLFGIARVNGALSLTRAIGDLHMRDAGIIPEPDVLGFDLKDVEYLMQGCDGVFDMFTTKQVDDIMRSMIYEEVVGQQKTDLWLIQSALKYYTGFESEADTIMRNHVQLFDHNTSLFQNVDRTASRSKRMSQVITKMSYMLGSNDNVTCVVALRE